MVVMAVESKCCGGCCCSSRIGLIIYCAIFGFLWLINLYQYAPVRGSSFGLTFMMDDVVDDAKKFCASPEACPEICECGGETCDMEELVSTRKAGQYIYFVCHLFFLVLCAIGLVGAAARQEKLLTAFIMKGPGILFLEFIGAILLSTASGKPVQAWYLYNKDDLDDEDAECTAKWRDDADTAGLVSMITMWVFYVIGFAVVSHMIYTAFMTRRDVRLKRAGALAVHPRGTEMGVVSATAVATATATAVGTPVVATPVQAMAAPVPTAVATAVATPSS